MLLSTISFIYHTNTFKGRKYPTPESTLFVVEERLEGLKYNIEAKGKGTFGERLNMFTMQKGGHFMKVSQHFCRLIVVFKKLLGDNLSVRSFLLTRTCLA